MKVSFCNNNRGKGTALRRLEEERPDIEASVEKCLGICGPCAEQPVALVGGRKETGKDGDDLYRRIVAALAKKNGNGLDRRTIHVGTCSWAEKSLIASGEFYPKGVSSAEERLKYYASRFGTVEIDATYYAIPASRMAELWAERTPGSFLFHVKVYGALTGHGIDPRTLPGALRELLPAAAKKKRTIRIEEPELLKAVAGAFVASLDPLRTAGKLGLLVFQFPPWFRYGTADLDQLLACRELMGGLSIAVEFRNGSWLDERRREEVFRFLRGQGITYVTADEPQYGTTATVPFLPEATTDIAYLRLHGRNRDTWLRRGAETSERYDYLYSAAELADFAAAARRMARKAKTVFVMFNNCRAGHAMQNALEFLKILG